MTDRLGPSGVGALTTGLQSEVLAHLRAIARPEAPDATSLDAFVAALDGAAMTYRIAETLRDMSRAANVRGELAALQAAFLRLVDRVNGLGGLSRQILYSEGSATGREDMHAALDTLAQQIAAARTRAAAMPVGGPQSRRFARLYLAIDVARAMRSHLQLEPTTTRGGLFEALLKTLLEALIPDTDDPSVRDLMRDALKARVTEHPDGVIEVDPGVG